MAGIHMGPGGMQQVNPGMQMTIQQQQQIQLQQQQQQQQQIQQQMIQQQTPSNQQQQQIIHQQPQQGQQPQPAAPTANPGADQQKLDHVAKVKSLLWPLKENLATAMKCAAQNFYQNGMIDIGTLKGTDVQVPRFDKQLEEFYSVCDQIELNLQAIINCCTQSTSSQKYVPPTVSQVRQEPTSMSSADVLTYTNYINITRNQVSYIKDVMDALNETAQNLSGD